ncbi:MAG: hypothetical protein FWD87_02550 [Spirochaetaceae bacterium]|nr:hypothetical protein [Spirochaetaceae bacterium]
MESEKETTPDNSIDEESVLCLLRRKCSQLWQKWVKKTNIWSKRNIIILAVLNLIVLSLIIVALFHNTAQRRQFNDLLRQCDLNISRNAYDTAETILQNILPYAVSKRDYMRILKRANIIADRTDNYQNLMLFSERAHNRFRRDRDILTIYVYSLIKNRNFARIINLIDSNRTLAIPESFIYVMHAIKYKQDSDQDSLRAIKNDDIRNIIKGSTDLTLYEQMYNRSGKPVVLTNYLLTILLTGDYKKAASVLDNSIYRNQINTELSGLIYYDNQEFRKAKDLFDRLFIREETEITDPGLIMLLADTLIHTGNYQDAYDLYNIVISSHERFSWVPYVNKDWINMVSGKRTFYTEEAINIFQNERKLPFLAILKNQPYETIGETTRNQDRYIAEFWEYFAEDNMTEEFKIFFLRELFRMGRFNDVFIFTGKRNNIDREWAIFFNALTSFSTKDHDNALQLFHRYYSLAGDWRGLYNMGIIELLSQNHQYAANYFEIIVNRYVRNGADISSEDLGDIFLMLSFSLTMTGDRRRGQFFLNRTMETGHSSILSQFLQNYYRTR